MEKSLQTTAEIIENALNHTTDYLSYRKMVQHWSETASNSGPVKTEALANYTQLNDRRMRRWDKTLKLDGERLRELQLPRKIIWLVITESWCGDASPSLPVMHKMAQAIKDLELKIVFRDENVDLMNAFLTNGAMSIPKLIMLDALTHEVLGNWGPRSTVPTKMVQDYKKQHGTVGAALKQDLQTWYNKNKGQDVFDDLMELLTSL
ncbi:Hypothetical protein I595_1241 [Croceitalea dokdonensis DOKDO 023]|uniref:Thioredoxin n=1 Tax=Croceitalea dokdonensis DOKDO 023 TaxID=1300341 RepID=A0A0P7A7N2_9FLAO|nr:thioredoxin family protein [Croceitalea dokdonensis]KPM32814.1 Hypothetical protein I595_1241 [Croceitalea dokdonensis DOKDO 023]